MKLSKGLCECQEGFYKAEEGGCYACDEGCADCTGRSNACTKCKGNYELKSHSEDVYTVLGWPTGTGYCSCPDGYIENPLNRESCIVPCKAGFYPDSANKC